MEQHPEIAAAVAGLRNGLGLPAKFKKKPVVVDAIQWDGTNTEAVRAFCPGAQELRIGKTKLILQFRTLEGSMHATINDWIIKGVKGEFYPCKPDIFAACYEPTTEAWVR